MTATPPTPDSDTGLAEALAAHWSYEPTRDFDGWLCECGVRIMGREGDLDAAQQAHVATALAPLFTEHGAAERRAGAVEALRDAADAEAALWGPAAFVVERILARAAALGDRAEEADPADYGPVGAGGGEPEEVVCLTCGHAAIEHTAGRHSIYGVCP